jgi:GTPase involved in cell partitioning and DNA repair
VVADIPGLIEGAHDNRGLGHNFLRHIERCSAFLFVVDLSAGVGGRPGIRPWEALDILRTELEAYLPGLSKRPALVVGTKTDMSGSSRAADALRRTTDLPVVTVSAIPGGVQGIDGLLAATELLMRAAAAQDAEIEEPMTLREVGEAVSQSHAASRRTSKKCDAYESRVSPRD